MWDASPARFWRTSSRYSLHYGGGRGRKDLFQSWGPLLPTSILTPTCCPSTLCLFHSPKCPGWTEGARSPYLCPPPTADRRGIWCPHGKPRWASTSPTSWGRASSKRPHCATVRSKCTRRAWQEVTPHLCSQRSPLLLKMACMGTKRATGATVGPPGPGARVTPAVHSSLRALSGDRCSSGASAPRGRPPGPEPGVRTLSLQPGQLTGVQAGGPQALLTEGQIFQTLEDTCHIIILHP